MNAYQRARLLADCPLFAQLNAADIQQLATAAHARNYRRGQILFYQGDPGDSILLVAQGQLKVYSMTEDGEAFLLSVVGKGQSLGEVSLADGGPRSATVEALTDVSVIRVSREAVLDLAATSPALTHAMLACLSTVVRRLTGEAADLALLDLHHRLAKFLLSECPSGANPVFDLPLTQAEIASRVGSTRQGVNAALRDLQHRGWITRTGHRVRIRDASALERFVRM